MSHFDEKVQISKAEYEEYRALKAAQEYRDWIEGEMDKHERARQAAHEEATRRDIEVMREAGTLRLGEW